jgi:rod shape determining protein RodA
LKRQDDITASKLDWLTIMLYALLTILGWLNIYAAVYDEQLHSTIFDISLNSGRQLIWIGTSVLLIIAIMVIDFRFYNSFAYFFYGFVILLLILVMLFGTEVAGAKAWFEIGPFRIQPAEFAKFSTALAVAKYLESNTIKIDKAKDLFVLGAIIALPALFILLQNDTGTALVFAAFVLVLYREGLSPIFLILGIVGIVIFVLTLMVDEVYLMIAIGVLTLLIIGIGKKTTKRIVTVVSGAVLVMGIIFSVDYVVDNVLQPHQQNRIKALINPNADPLGYGWNVTQSKIAIGSGGLTGKGFLEGTQTKFDFVPEQSTDFIFCTIGEEHGWVGSLVLISLFVGLLLRIVYLAERQKSRFARAYGYAVVSILFFHFLVNIGMTIGLAPVIGIPLPFFSYGGSSLWSFTILLFILVKLDAHRMQMLVR